MTRPYKRACHQTNFSEGEFVKKDPFSFFDFFFLIFPSLFPGHFFSIFFNAFFKEGWQLGWFLGRWRFTCQHRENEVMC